MLGGLYFFQCLIVEKAGGIFWQIQLLPLYLLAEFPEAIRMGSPAGKELLYMVSRRSRYSGQMWP